MALELFWILIPQQMQEEIKVLDAKNEICFDCHFSVGNF